MAEWILESAAPQADKRVQYGSGPFQFADLRYPSDATQPWPVVMNIHGGFWRAKYDLAHAGHFCAALARAGLASYNIEYRRVGNPGGGWPETFNDVKNAYSYLRQHEKELGVDLSRLIVMGHSAGGQLALCLAAHEPEITGAVSLAGVLDLHRAYELHLSNDAVVQFLGGTPEQVSERYREASPMFLKVNARQVVITGTADTSVPPEMSLNYAESKKKTGERVSLVQIPGADHFDVIDPRTDAFENVLRAVKELLG